jgi:hypothetical protein
MTCGGVDAYVRALVGGEWSASRLGRLTARERVPIGQEAVWDQEPVWTTWTGIKSSSVLVSETYGLEVGEVIHLMM